MTSFNHNYLLNIVTLGVKASLYEFGESGTIHFTEQTYMHIYVYTHIHTQTYIYGHANSELIVSSLKFQP